MFAAVVDPFIVAGVVHSPNVLLVSTCTLYSIVSASRSVPTKFRSGVTLIPVPPSAGEFGVSRFTVGGLFSDTV